MKEYFLYNSSRKHHGEVEKVKYLELLPDTYSCIQEGEVLIPKGELIKNDVYDNVVNNPLIKFANVGKEVNGNISVVGDNIKFKSVNKVGLKAGFEYYAYAEDKMESGNVKVNILPLPEVDIYLFPTDELEGFKDNYIPPTLGEIFKTWGRISNHNLYFPSGTTPTGEAAAWEMISDSQFRCTVNSSNITGFISPELFDSYTHECDFSSTDSDDDSIMLIIAFKRINNINHMLLLERESKGMTGLTNSKGFSIYYIFGQHTWNGNDSGSKTIALPIGNKCKTSSGGWNVNSPTRVKVVRNTTSITCYSSPFKSTNLDSGEVISINLSDYPELSWVKEKANYGYACWSQNYSSFTNVIFEGGGGLNAKELFDLTTGEVWGYKDGVWGKTGERIQDVIGWPRIVRNPVNGKKYNVLENTIVEIK